MPRRKVDYICDVCKVPACKGGCYYRPADVERGLKQLPYSRTVLSPSFDDFSSSRLHANPLEAGWAERADILRALDFVAASAEDGGLTRLIVYLAYAGTKSDRREGTNPGLSDSDLAGRFGMDRSTVRRHRERGLRLMVACLNPEYEWKEEE